MGSRDPLTVALPDGRRIAYLDGGDPADHPVLGLHGTPGCRLNRLPGETVHARAGVRYITTHRAGYGQSSRHHGRAVAAESLQWAESGGHLPQDLEAEIASTFRWLRSGEPP